MTRLVWRMWEGGQPTGIDHVCRVYLEHFASQSQGVVHFKHFRTILSPQASASLFDILLGDGRWYFLRMTLWFWRNVFNLFRRFDGAGRIYLNVGHTGLDKEDYRQWETDNHVRPIYLVHDLIPITHPQFCRDGEDEKHTRRMINLIETAHGIIANSAHTEATVQRFATVLGLAMPPSCHAWLGTREFPATTPIPADEVPTFLTIGTIEGRKNHALLLNVWSQWCHAGAEGPKLLIIGQRGWQCEDVHAQLDTDVSLRRLIREVPDCSDEELAQHLRSARALLFPSHAEGYGMPLAEALSMGVPAIVADLDAFREFARDVPEYIDVNDQAAWAARILDYAAADSPARTNQLERLKSWHMPDWADHFAIIDQWLGTLERRQEPR